MVQKYQSPVRVYKYPFELVMAAYERRFPSCDMIPVFEGSEIIDEKKSEDGAIHIVTRKCKLNVDAPYLLKKIAGVDYFYCIQKNTLDLSARSLKIEAWNESFASRLVIQEYCTYFVHPENSEWTCFEQSASLEVKSFFGFENAVEKLAAKHYGASIKKGKEVIEHFINKLKSEGITYIEPFKANSDNGVDEAKDNLKENNKLAVEKRLSGNSELNELNNLIKEDAIDKQQLEKLGSEQKEDKIGNTGSPGKVGNSQQKRNEMKRSKQHSISNEANFPSSNANSKLEADYIAKCIGEMTPYQESCLVQLKKRILETYYNQNNQTNLNQKKKMPSDQTLMRFLLAHNYNLEKAREMLCSSLVWRKKHQVDKILSTYILPEVVQKYFPGCWLNHDKDGRPIYMLNIGQMDLKGFVKSIGQEGLVKLTLHICEQGLKKAEEATKSFGKPISSLTLLLDLDGLNMRHLWRPGIRTVLHIIEMVEANYPETLGRVIMTRAPRVFPIVWTMLSTFINENTYKKFVFLGDQQDLKVLEQFIDIKDIPIFLGGKLYNPPSLSNGGLIPKSHYVSDEHANEINLLDSTMYTSISLGKGQTHEILYDIKDSLNVICWDFNVLKQEIVFSLVKLNSQLPVNEHKEDKSHSKDNLHGSIKRSVSKENLGGDKAKGKNIEETKEECDSIVEKTPLQNRLSGDASCGLIIPKNWQLNKDYQPVEPEMICREGDSIQGSHITLNQGKYVLQWKYNEPSLPHHHSFSSHKAKIMYYCEVIKSKDFRGSMTSLQSSHSGTTLASGQSANGSCPSR